MKIGRLAATGIAFVLLGVAAEAEPERSASERSATISLASGVVDTAEKAVAEVPAALDVAASPGGEELVLVKFPRPVTATQLAALESRVERVYTYLPDDAFLVRIPPGRRHLLDDSELGASWSGPYHPAYKISPALAAVEPDEKQDKALPGDERRSVLVHVYPDASLDEVVAGIERLGRGEVVAARRKTRFSRVRLLMTPAEIAAARDRLALLPEVFWIDLEPRRVLMNDTTVWVAQSGTGGGRRTPVHDRGLVGQRQVVAVLDTGIDPDMCYFRDPDLGLPPRNVCDGGTAVDRRQRKVLAVDFLWSGDCAGGIAPTEWDDNGHGTHVAGTLAGDDFSNPLSHNPGDGLAPGAKLVIQDGGVMTDDCADLPGLGCPVVDLNPIFLQAYRQGARIHSNSWGDDENNPQRGLYSAGSEDADEFVWEHKDFLPVFAAGNAGPGAGTVISPATGKNVVAAGATQRGAGAEQMAGFSSCGPTADGRIKPDVTMPGAGIFSADSDRDADSMNCGVRSLSGTSMATPGVAGALTLIRQYFTAGFHPSGAASPADAVTPSAALLKATLIHSGHDMAGAAAIPGACQGWGRALLDDALYFAGDARRLFVEDDATGFAGGSSGDERDFELFVDPGGSPLKVTLAWSDFPSTPAAGRNLVNDLDLVVRGPGGTYLGNVFAGGASVRGGAADRRNNVEQVLLRSPDPGPYTVTVRSFTVPRGPQPFALVVSGDLGECVADGDCDDGLACNGVEACVADGCRAGTPIDCGGPGVPATALCLGGGRFCAEVRWSDFEGGGGRGNGSALTADSGTFWFFDPENVELIVKVLDACVAPFDRFWVFAAGLTNLGVELAVTDLATGEVAAYANPAGSAFEPIQDTSAFATCDSSFPFSPPGIVRELEGLLARPVLPVGEGRAPTLQASETCTPGTEALCLNGGRFRVEAMWETAAGQAGPGRAVPLTGDTGYFWFFGPDNVEVVIKVLDACVAPFDHFWVFAAGLTNVEVTLRVTDTVSGEMREYRNPQGTAFRPIQDTEAFATCP